MFNEMPKKLIIVGNKDTDTICEYMSMLVSSMDDLHEGDEKEIIGIKDGSVDTAIWTEEIYRDNRAHTSSRQKMLFIGNDKCASNISKNIQFIEADKNFGIYYGWLGNKAVIYVDETLSRNKILYEGEFKIRFEELMTKYNNSLRVKMERKSVKNTKNHFIGNMVAPGIAEIAFLVFDSGLNKRTATENGYRYATLKFYLNYLSTFME